MFGDPRIKALARSLGTMTYNFRSYNIGMDRLEAINNVKESWFGCEIAELDPEAFRVTNEAVIPFFDFIFHTPENAGFRVQRVAARGKDVFSDIILIAEPQGTAYFLRDPRPNKQIKQLCKALRKQENIPQGELG